MSEVSTQVAEGNPYALIPQATADEGCDLVVIATHGRSGLGRALLGSVADHVVRNTPTATVLIVHPDE